ncbi:MAG: Glu/Leu/Phe/Val dehydrogenase dimerization domain-containing protein [Streptosporangiaceae bacterium]
MAFDLLSYMSRWGHKKVIACADPDTGLRAVIAIHSTALGPATGGTRMWPYESDDQALLDALRLARGMTYKYAAAGVDLGGGKGVIIGDPRTDKTEALLRAYGRFVDSLRGEYLTGEDVGTTLEDMETIYAETNHVVTLPEHCGGAGDISPATALGSVMAAKACAERVWGSPSLEGRRVALQGLGIVGSKALPLMLAEGAVVVVTDLDQQRVTWARDTHGVAAVEPEEIYRQDVDIFAPYALGGVINDETIPQLRCRIVAGSANNILAEERHGDELERRGLVYAVDYVANSGGTIFDTDRLRKGGFQPDRAMTNVRRIFERIHEIFDIAAARQLPLYRAADLLAEQRIASLKSLPLLDAPRPRT